MSENKWSAFETFLQNKMEEEQIAGAAVAVSQNGTVIFQRGFGVRDCKTREPVTPDTVFGIASVSKSFTALAIMKLAEQGRLSIDDPVNEYLPEFKLKGLEDSNSVKIHHLLSHTTGLPPMRRREDFYQLNHHLNYLANEDYDLLGKPGEFFSYCNDTFLLLGAIIERLTGRLFRRYMTHQILEPFQMHRSTYSLEEVAKLSNVSVPYRKDEKTNRLEEVAWPTLGNYEVGGGIRSTVQDLVRYGQVFLQNDNTLKKMWQPLHQIGRNAYYGYALRITPDYSGVTLVQHGGGQPGVSSNFGFVPEKGLVVACLTNVENVSAGEIWLSAANTALGFPLEQKESVEPYYDASLEQLQPLVGTYQSAEGGNVRVFLDKGRPVAEINNKEFGLRASDDHTLVIEKNEMPIRFFFKSEESAWAVLFGSRMLTRTTGLNEKRGVSK